MPRPSRLARLLQWSVFAQVAIAAVYAAWRWPASPVQAVAGTALLLLAGPLVLGFEVLISARVGRSDRAAPQPTALQLLRAWLAESAHLFRVFWWRQPFRWRAVPDHLDGALPGRTGVVFVHGFMCNRGFWNGWMQRLRSQGHAYVAVNLEPVFTSIDAYADEIDRAVVRITRSTGCPPLLVCHSMGGLAARAWWRRHGRARQVAALVTIGSPHGGTWMARFSHRPNGRQMCLGSDWLQALAQHELHHPLPSVVCWFSNCDNIVFPPSTATLPAADNRFLPGQPHVGLAFQPKVLDHCLALLQRLDGARQGKSVTAVPLENG